MYGRTFFIALTLVAALATALVYGLGGWLAFTGSLSAGDVVALALLLSRLYGPLTALSNVRVDVMSAMVSFDRVFEVLDLQPMIREAPDAVPVPAGDRSIEFDACLVPLPAAADVSLPSLEEVSLPEHGGPVDVLHDVSFRVEPGQLVALVGQSGAGKSTIAKLVPRLYDVTGGAVRVGGVDVRRVDARLAARQRSASSARTRTCSTTPSAPTCSTPARRRPRSELWAALEGAQIADLVRSLPEGLDTVVGDRGYRLSGGEKQRLAIARVLLKAPGHRDPRRGDRAPGQRVGGRRAARAGHRAGRPDVAGDRPPAVDDPQRRPDPGGRRRSGRGVGHARGVAGARGAVRRPVPHPVRRRRASNGRGRLTHYRHSCPSSSGGVRSVTAAHPQDAQIRALYAAFLDGWNRRSGAAVAAGFADDGDIIGFDGSHHRGRLSIAADLRADLRQPPDRRLRRRRPLGAPGRRRAWPCCSRTPG